MRGYHYGDYYDYLLIFIRLLLSFTLIILKGGHSLKLMAKKIDSNSINELLDKKIRWLTTSSTPLRIILFGSAANGEMTEASDIDLIVIYANNTDLKDTQKNIAVTRPKDDWPHDLLLYTEETFNKSVQKGGGVCWLAEREGKIIFTSEKLYVTN